MKLFKQHFLHRIHHHISQKHKSVLAGISSRGFSLIGGSLLFGAYPVLITTLTGSETTAGIFISVMTFLQFIILDMIAGIMIDRYGVKKIGILGLSIGILSSIPFFLDQNVITATIVFIGLLFRASFLIIDPLILQNTNSKDGGFWFGIKEEICSVGSFLGALAIPFFILAERWIWIGIIWALTQGIALLFLSMVSQTSQKKKIISHSSPKINLFGTLKAGLHFIKVNHKYPLFAVGSFLFQGVFYGAIWFVFPIYIADQIITNNGSLSLGIHEIMKLTLAIVCGILADRINWKILEEYAWILMIIMVWILPFWHSINALIFVGIFIGISANFFVAAGNHALAQHDEDHEEDGQFASFSRIIMNIGFALSPVIVGYLYQYVSFAASLVFIAGVVTFIGIWMITLCFKLKE